MQGTQGLVPMAIQTHFFGCSSAQPIPLLCNDDPERGGGGINRHISPQTVDLKLTSRTDNSETNQKDVNYTLLEVERAHTLASVGVQPEAHSVNTIVCQLLKADFSKAGSVGMGLCGQWLRNQQLVFLIFSRCRKTHQNLACFWKILGMLLSCSEWTFGHHYPFRNQFLQTTEWWYSYV